MAKLIGMLTEEHDQTKKTALREATAAATEKKANNETIKRYSKTTTPCVVKRTQGERPVEQIRQQQFLE